MTVPKHHKGTVLSSLFCLALLLFVLAMTFALHPYFGNMDDGGFLEVARHNGPIGFSHILSGSFGTGFIRTSSMLISWPSFWVGAHLDSTWFFAVNAIVVFACLVACRL
jgi:hypothetical protein